ncbi:MAG: GNAT family N-acetyltransferase [Deltaproteobacteria bacterium]|nr:GNAT family N-acetyltransferase [Deltaproteobacteria bacterium]
MEIQPLNPSHRESLGTLISRIDSFTKEEMEWANLDVDRALQPGNREYSVLVSVQGDRVVGFACYGPTPLAHGVYDLYWVAADPDVRGQGIGAALMSAMEGELRRRSARLIRIETSATEAYGPTKGFYQALRYVEECRFRDFYKVGDDLIILKKLL